MKVIVGLGNPGLRYSNTRHNAGFMVCKELSGRTGIPLRKKGFGGRYGIGRVGGLEIMIFQPQTYMNLSGEAVASVYSAKIKEIKDLLVISDDISLPLGHIRLREKGSSGGHNGLGSIIEHIGPGFARLRVGIGAAPGEGEVSDYVLSGFGKKEKPVLAEAVEKAAKCSEMWLKEDIKNVMSRYNEKSAAYLEG